MLCYERNQPESRPHAIQVATVPPSILQVFTFYEAYLDDFYRTRPGLADAPYAIQMEELYRDGFCVLHVHAPTLTELGSRATWVIANCEQTQRRWALENGLTVDPRDWRHQILRAQIAAFQPEALYLLNPIDFDSRFIRTLLPRPSIVIGWRAASIPPHVDWTEFDLIVSHLSVCREQAIQHGARDTAYFHPSVPTFLGDLTASIPREFDVVFSGQWTPEHRARNEMLNAIAEASEREGFSFGLFLSSHHFELPPAVARCNRGARWGLDMYRALRSGRIVLNAEIDLARGEAGNLRLFETTSVGSFLITEHQRNIEQYFNVGQHIDTYRTVEELLTKIRLYLHNESKREGMACAAQRHIQATFSPLRGAQELLGFCESIRTKKFRAAATSDSRTKAQDALNSAVTVLKLGDPQEALRLVERVSHQSEQLPDLEFIRGICLGKLARFSDAAAALEQELSAFPNNVAARELLECMHAEARTTRR